MKYLSMTALACLLAAPVVAQEMASLADPIPAPRVAYQGRLLEGGLPVTGERTFVFSLQDAAKQELWNSGDLKVSVNNGLYGVLLGGPDMPPIPASVLARSPLRLQIAIQSQLLSPDVELVAALQARSAFEVTGGFSGDVGGTQNAITLLRLQGIPLDMSTAPTSGQALVFDGTSWRPSSVAGVPGAKGDTGPQGPQGEPGAPGPTGPRGSQGPQGIAGPMGPQGPQGIAGPTGAKGDTGAQGPSSLSWKGDYNPALTYQIDDVVSSSGSSFVAIHAIGAGNVPSLVSADWKLIAQKGDTGATGPTGPTGSQGATGPAGTKGDTGAQGPLGAKGDTGDTGAPGAVGATGAAGRTILNGTTDPVDGTGNTGDFYLRTDTSTLFGPKAASGGTPWGTGTSLVGAAGGGVSEVKVSAPLQVANATTQPALSIGANSIDDTYLKTITTAGKVSNSATTASSISTAGAIVTRDGSGNFAAGTITANLTGNVTGNVSGTATNVTGTVAVANGGTGATTLSANSVLLGSGTNALQTVAPGASGNVLTSDGTTWKSQTPSGGGSATTVVVTATSYTVASGVTHVVSTLSGDNTITLPNPAGNANRVITISAPASDGSVNFKLTINATGGANIGSAFNNYLNQPSIYFFVTDSNWYGGVITCVCDGNKWYCN